MCLFVLQVLLPVLPGVRAPRRALPSLVCRAHMVGQHHAEAPVHPPPEGGVEGPQRLTARDAFAPLAAGAARAAADADARPQPVHPDVAEHGVRALQDGQGAGVPDRRRDLLLRLAPLNCGLHRHTREMTSLANTAKHLPSL